MKNYQSPTVAMLLYHASDIVSISDNGASEREADILKFDLGEH